MPTQSYLKPLPPDRKWWKSATIYQIYPSSFKDSNGDGIGDLNGIHSKLDYLKDLGVDVVWLSPIYKSPQADMGYDISDYQDIDPRYGTLEDWDRLVKGLHDRGMKIMMDLVVNHSSDEHEWFKASRSSKDDPKRDWYIWRLPKYDENGNKKEPNNWKAQFQGSAWDFDEKTQEYYLHLYLPGQPDLNWENEEVREAVWTMMNWWLDRGVDGFRMDVINLISKVPGLPDAPVINPKDPYQPATEFYTNGPRVHEYIKEMNRRVLSQRDPLPLTVGETPMTHNMNDLAQFVLPANKELDMVFQFEIMEIDGAREGSPRAVAPGTTQLPIAQDFEAKKVDCQALKPREWKLTEFKEIINRWQNHLRGEGFWNSVYIENHDHSRSVSRFGQTSTPLLRALSAKLLAMLQIGQGGSIYVYQGEEIGMANAPKSWGIEEYKDAATQRWYAVKLKERMEEAGTDNPEDIDMSDIMDGIQKKARDHARTPVQWDSTPHAGFTSPNSEPWMRVVDDYDQWNVANQLTDINTSVLGFWREALKARKTWDVLVYGEFKLLPSLESDERIFAFVRYLPTEDSHAALFVLNFSIENVQISLHTSEILENISADLGQIQNFRLVLRNYAGGSETKMIVTGHDEVVKLELQPCEGLMYVNY